MEANGDSMSVEPMRLTDAEAYVYEAIATLQYLERPATQEKLEAVAELAGPEIARILRDLRARELVVERPGDSPAYQLARRARAIALPDDDPGAT